MKIIALFLALAGISLFAQATHSATLTWTDAQNPMGTTYNVYRATGLCSGTPSFSKIAMALTVLTYQDTTVTPGNYCFMVTATFNSVESPPSASVPAPVLPFAPSGVSIVVQ